MNWLAGHTKQLWIAAGIAAAVTLVAGIVVYVCIMVPILPGGATIVVPDFAATAEQPDPTIFEVSVEYDYSDAEPGTVIKQSPAAGSRRKISDGHPCRLTLTVSRGKRQLTLPELAGLDSVAATTKLQRMGLMAEIEAVPGPEGQVISTSPAAGASVRTGDSIRLCVGNTSVTLPDVRGLSEAAARRELERLGFKVERSEYAKSARPAGTVTGQSTSPGERLPLGGSVTLTVSQGQ